MNKYGDKIHKISNIISLLLIIIGVIRTLFIYKYLPDNIGVHFDADGSFDVIVNKNKWVALYYPYIVSIGILIVSEIIAYLLSKVKVGLKINRDKEEKIRLVSLIFIDIFIKFIWIFFLSVIWSDCVIRQHYLNTLIPNTLFIIQFLSTVFIIIYIIIIRIKK